MNLEKTNNLVDNVVLNLTYFAAFLMDLTHFNATCSVRSTQNSLEDQFTWSCCVQIILRYSEEPQHDSIGIPDKAQRVSSG